MAHRKTEGFPLQIEKQYLRAIDRFLNAIDSDVRKIVRQEVNFRKPVQDGLQDIQRKLSQMMVRFQSMRILKILEKTTKNVIKSADNFARRLTRISVRSKKRNKPEFREQLEEIEIAPRDDQEIEGIVQGNVALIKTVGEEYFAQIQNNIVENIREGKSQKELEAMLAKDTKVERNRAKFWASDQLGKTYSALSKKNQIESGFPNYYWRTQTDARVRDTHAELEGQKFSWDDPPILNGSGKHPGEDFNCRCFSEPALDDEEELEPEERLEAIQSILQKTSQ